MLIRFRVAGLRVYWLAYLALSKGWGIGRSVPVPSSRPRSLETL